MDTPPLSEPSPASESSVLREIITDAIRYWETRRIMYNLLLAAVVIAWLVLTWPHFREASRKKNRKTGKRRNLGTFRTRAAAQEHERAVQFFKRR